MRLRSVVWPRVGGLTSELLPGLGRNGFCSFEKRRGVIKFVLVIRLEMEPIPNMNRNGDLPLGGKGCCNGAKQAAENQ